MEIFTFTFICVVILYAVTKYIEHTTEVALNKRWKFVDLLEDIKKDEDYSDNFRYVIKDMFVNSMDRKLLPKMTLIVGYMRLFKKQELKSIHGEFKEEILVKDKEHLKYQEAVKLMMEVNFYCAPHWYLFFGVFIALFILLYSVFAKANKMLNKTIFEMLVFATARPAPQHNI
jgi:hypothetical protein